MLKCLQSAGACAACGFQTSHPALTHSFSVSPICRWLCSGRSSDLGRCSVEGAFELDCLAYTMRLAEERGCNCSFEVKPVDGLPAARQQNRWADTCLACSAQSSGETVHFAAEGRQVAWKMGAAELL